MKPVSKFLSIFLIIFLSGCSIAEGQANEVRTFDGIEGVALMGSGNVSITTGNKEEITIHAPADLIPYLITEIKDGTLYIGKHKKGWKKFKHLHKNISYDMVVKTIDHARVSGSGDLDAEKLVGDQCIVKVSGSGNINLDEIDSDRTKVHISGSGDVEIDNLSADILGVTISGSGDVKINGNVDEFDLTISGSGDCNAGGLKTEDASVDIYGSGDAKFAVEETLNVQIMGSGDVIYYGNPSVNSRITGSGDVKRSQL